MNVPAASTTPWIPIPGEQIESKRCIYSIGDQISSNGAFSVVFKCYDEWHNGLVAKVLRRPFQDVQDDWTREVKTLLHLRHPFITFPFDAFTYNGGCYLILEYCRNPLDEFLKFPDIDGNFWIPYFASDILQALGYIHSADIVHKDLHPGNVYVSVTNNRLDQVDSKAESIFQFKIGDLGISRLESDIKVFNETMHQSYLPPEYFNPGEFGIVGKATDMYHVGLLMLGMIQGGFQDYTTEDILNGVPRQQAESSRSVYGPAVAVALRRHVKQRYATSLEFWRAIKLAYRSDTPLRMSEFDIGQ